MVGEVVKVGEGVDVYAFVGISVESGYGWLEKAHSVKTRGAFLSSPDALNFTFVF